MSSIKKEDFEYAAIMMQGDNDPDSLRRGVTINTATMHFKLKDKNFTIIDAPGHTDFIHNMIKGANQSDCAILVVEGNTGAFERGFDGGSTKDHAQLARALGIQQIIVAINKLDYDDTNYSEQRYDFVCN